MDKGAQAQGRALEGAEGRLPLQVCRAFMSEALARPTHKTRWAVKKRIWEAG